MTIIIGVNVGAWQMPHSAYKHSSIFFLFALEQIQFIVFLRTEALCYSLSSLGDTACVYLFDLAGLSTSWDTNTDKSFGCLVMLDDTNSYRQQMTSFSVDSWLFYRFYSVTTHTCVQPGDQVLIVSMSPDYKFRTRSCHETLSVSTKAKI
jgi:hypothetical protein